VSYVSKANHFCSKLSLNVHTHHLFSPAFHRCACSPQGFWRWGFAQAGETNPNDQNSNDQNKLEEFYDIFKTITEKEIQYDELGNSIQLTHKELKTEIKNILYKIRYFTEIVTCSSSFPSLYLAVIPDASSISSLFGAPSISAVGPWTSSQSVAEKARLLIACW
jgi:hypothetical protein